MAQCIFSEFRRTSCTARSSRILGPFIVILNWFLCVVRCSFRSCGPLLIAHAIASLVPLLHCHGTWIYSCVSWRLSSLLWPSWSHHQTPGRWCVERMRGLHHSTLHGDCSLLLVTTSPNSRPNAAFIHRRGHKAREKGDATLMQKVHKSHTQ